MMKLPTESTGTFSVCFASAARRLYGGCAWKWHLFLCEKCCKKSLKLSNYLCGSPAQNILVRRFARVTSACNPIILRSGAQIEKYFRRQNWCRPKTRRIHWKMDSFNLWVDYEKLVADHRILHQRLVYTVKELKPLMRKTGLKLNVKQDEKNGFIKIWCNAHRK